MPQTPDVLLGVYDAAAGIVRATLQPAPYNRRVLKISFISGPAGSAFTLYRGYVIDPSTVLTTTLIGTRNSYDASTGLGAIELFAGEAATAVWADSAGGLLPAPTVTVRANIVSQWGWN